MKNTKSISFTKLDTVKCDLNESNNKQSDSQAVMYEEDSEEEHDNEQEYSKIIANGKKGIFESDADKIIYVNYLKQNLKEESKKKTSVRKVFKNSFLKPIKEFIHNAIYVKNDDDISVFHNLDYICDFFGGIGFIGGLGAMLISIIALILCHENMIGPLKVFLVLNTSIACPAFIYSDLRYLDDVDKYNILGLLVGLFINLLFGTLNVLGRGLDFVFKLGYTAISNVINRTINKQRLQRRIEKLVRTIEKKNEFTDEEVKVESKNISPVIAKENIQIKEMMKQFKEVTEVIQAITNNKEKVLYARELKLIMKEYEFLTKGNSINSLTVNKNILEKVWRLYFKIEETLRNEKIAKANEDEFNSIMSTLDEIEKGEQNKGKSML